MDMPLEDFGKSEECRPKAEPCKHYWILSIDENDIKWKLDGVRSAGLSKDSILPKGEESQRIKKAPLNNYLCRKINNPLFNYKPYIENSLKRILTIEYEGSRLISLS